MNVEEMTAVCAALDVAKRSGELTDTFFDFQHDICYIPWEKRTGIVAEMLEAADCHWNTECGCWASF